MPADLRPARMKLRVEAVPRVDRFFPSCSMGLVEVLAKLKYSIPSICNCWFANTFEYAPPTDGRLVVDDDTALALDIGVGATPRLRAKERLVAFHGLEVREHQIQSHSELLDGLTDFLRSGLIAIVSCDLSVVQGRKRAEKAFSPHMIGVTGLDASEDVVTAIDQVKGEIKIPGSELRRSFDRYQEMKHPFHLVDCVRNVPVPSDVYSREAILNDVRDALANLFSEESARGLTGLRRFVQDVRTATSPGAPPRSIPGMWIFSHDRSCLRRVLPQWRSTGAATPELIHSLKRELDAAFNLWFEVDMMVEAALYTGEAQWRNVNELLSEIVPVEERIVATLVRMVKVSLS